MAVSAAGRLLAAAVLAAGAASLISGTPCPPEWIQSSAWCYLTNTSSSLSWPGASAFCQERGGSLVMMENRSKLLDVVDLLKGLESVSVSPTALPPSPPPWTEEPVRRLRARAGRAAAHRHRRPGNDFDYHLQDEGGPEVAGWSHDALGIDKRWWIGIQKVSGTTAVDDRDPEILDNFGEDKSVKDTSSGDSVSHLCVYMTASDGLWYWTACDESLNYICQKEADRVHVVVVTPEHPRPDPAWLQAHEAALMARLVSNGDDDKGEFSDSKATMTPIPPTTTTTPMPTSAVAGDTTATTPSPCSGHNWRLLGNMCHQLFLDSKSHEDAEQFCQTKGGHLVQFEDASGLAAFRRAYRFASGSIWIGLSRPSASDQFQWRDHMPVRFSPWTPGHPGTSHNCAALDLSSGQWVTADCATPKLFSCYRSVNATEPPPPITITPTPGDSCGGGGWWQFGVSCLLLVSNTPATFYTADQQCRNRSATLVKVGSSQLNEDVRRKLNGVSAWIGLSKVNTANGSFMWRDGSNAEGASYWIVPSVAGDEPASCVQLDGGRGSWRLVNCNAPQPYVCQRPAHGTATPLPPPTVRPPPRSSCPPPWRPYGPDRCLRIFNQTMTWATARQWCRDQADGGDLLSVPSAVYQAFLTSAVRDWKVNLWISMSYGEVDRQRFLTWTDESPVDYTNWAPGQPTKLCDNCPKTCGVVDGRTDSNAAAWSDVDCTVPHGAICQRPATPNNSIAVNQVICNNTDSYIAAGSSCYKIVQSKQTWHDAAETCQNANGALAYVGDAFDNAELVKLLYRDGGNQYWLGLSDTAHHGIMTWTRPWPSDATYVNWDVSYTRKATRDSCAVLLPATGKWQHRDCSVDQRPFVCQLPSARGSPLAPAGHCGTEAGWVAGETRCYRAFGQTGAGLTWDEAKADCEARGYQLASVSSVTDFGALQAVSSLSVPMNAWIGLRSQQNKEFSWTDGSPITYRAWQRNEPSLPAACVLATRLARGRWLTVDCSRRSAYICAKGLVSPGTGAIFGEASGGGSGWAAFGVVLLVLALVVALAGTGLWYARRQRYSWVPLWLLRPRSSARSSDNLAYSRHKNTNSSDGAEENSNLDDIATNRWDSQEQLVIRENF